MTKFLTIRGLLLALLCVAGSLTSFAQTPFWTETFSDETTATTNWVNGGTNGGVEVWQWTNDPAAGYTEPGFPVFASTSVADGYFLFNSDANGEFDHDVTLTGTGVPASCTGKSNVHLRFHAQYVHFTAGAVAQLGVSTNGTDFTYTNLFVGLGANLIFEDDVDVDLNQADNAAQVWLQFRWTGNYEYHFKVDDLELYEQVVAPVNVAFRVNMSLQTVDPTGAFITGSFNGWTNEALTNMGNGVWGITKTLAAGDAYEYKFKNGATAEVVPVACGVTDGAGGLNRSTTPTADVTLAAVCFGSCNACNLPCNLNPDALICDNFDSYLTTLKLGPQATWWKTWSGTEGGTEDGIVSIEQANTPLNSLKILSTAATGGPQDVVLDLGNKTTGRYELSWKTFVPAGKNGYYNIQNIIPIAAGDWNLDVFYENGGKGHIQIGAGDTLAKFDYPNGAWFNVKHVIDLDNNFLSLWVNDNFVIKMPYAKNLGGIDFFGVNNVSTYYIDDVEYIKLAPVVYNVDVCDAAVDLTAYFGAAAGVSQTTGLYDNTTATSSPTDPEITCWNEAATANTDGSMWYTFTGDGKTYHIETVPCNATNYIGVAQQDDGDTQMLVYAGDSCDDLTEVVCGDDLYPTGVPDWRSGVDIVTDPGQNYYMLIDGFNFGGTVALGQFCIEITQVASVTCADGAVGTYAVPNPYLCFEAQLANLITVDNASFVLPNEGPVAGLAWAISSAPVPAGTWPSDAAGYLGSTGFLDAPFAVGYVNNGPPGFAFGIYYATPVVLGGGTTIDPTLANQIQNVDPSNGCFFVGASTQIFFLPLLDDISASVTTGNGSVDLTPGGGLGDLLGDPSVYRYLWSNGATTQDLSGVASGTYTCTVSDVSGCALEAIVTAQVSVGTIDPSSVQSFTVSPNPTSGTVMVNLALVSASDVRIEVLNLLGQTLQNLNIGTVTSVNQAVELGNLAQGSYLLRVTVDGETAIRRVVLQH